MGFLKTRQSTVSTAPDPTSRAKEFPMICSARFKSPFPLAIEQSGAPPMPNKFEKAEMMVMMGKVSPSPVSANVDASGRWPM